MPYSVYDATKCIELGKRGRETAWYLIMMSDKGDSQRQEPNPSAGEITRLLTLAENGSAQAQEDLLEKVYAELRVIATSYMRKERDGHTLSATALVNESYLKQFRGILTDSESLKDAPDSGGGFVYRHRHAFFQAAAVAMRRILIDHARAKATIKRGSRVLDRPISADFLEASALSDPSDILSLDEALSRFEEEDERAANVVRLRFYAGRQIDEIAGILGVSSRTIMRDWDFARVRLLQLIEGASESNEPG